MYKKTLYTIFLSIVFIYTLSFVQVSYAEQPEDCVSDDTDMIGLGCVEAGSGLSNKDPRIIIVNIINASLGLLGIVSVILILYAGFLWMTAGGNDEQSGKARKIIISSIIGLIIILSAWAITTFVLRNLYQATTGKPLGGYDFIN